MRSLSEIGHEMECARAAHALRIEEAKTHTKRREWRASLAGLEKRWGREIQTRHALAHVAAAERVDLREISEPMRQRIIDLGMMEPPLVDVNADQVYLTDAGRTALAESE